MAVLSEHDFGLGSVHIWTFSREELDHGLLDGVQIDTGDEDADHILRQIPVEVWERIALKALAFRLVLERDNALTALEQESREPGSTTGGG
jgi:hypothetical protein